MLSLLLVSLLTSCSNAPTPVPQNSTAGAPFCPPEMAAVFDGSSTNTAFCMDRYEARAVGDLGSDDQFLNPAEPMSATAVSEAGVEPTGLSFSQATALCERTPMKNAEGETVGTKRLASLPEWTDAGDGTIGLGGLRYPYGAEPDASRCPLTTGQKGDVDGVQPTGSYAGCVSPFGVQDQFGNLWEWVDSGEKANINGWLEHIKEETGLDVTVDADDTLRFSPHRWDGRTPLLVTLTNLDKGELQQDGRVVVPSNTIPDPSSGNAPTGYLSYGPLFKPSGTPGEAAWILPIQFVDTGQDGLASLRIRREADGTRVGFKVGGSWYSGAGARLDYLRPLDILVHAHDFRGSIAARCVGEALWH